MASPIGRLSRRLWAGTRPFSLLGAMVFEQARVAGARMVNMAAGGKGLEGLVGDNKAINGHANGDGNGSGNGEKKKLHGRAFYQSIGSPKFVLAPMVDQSEFVRVHCSMVSYFYN